MTIQTLDGKVDGPLPPLPYINFALLGPANGGSSNYKNLMLNRGSNYENLMLDLDKAYSGTLLETFEDGYIVYGLKPNSDVLKKLCYENYEGVTKFFVLVLFLLRINVEVGKNCLSNHLMFLLLTLSRDNSLFFNL